MQIDFLEHAAVVDVIVCGVVLEEVRVWYMTSHHAIDNLLLMSCVDGFPSLGQGMPCSSFQGDSDRHYTQSMNLRLSQSLAST